MLCVSLCSSLCIVLQLSTNFLGKNKIKARQNLTVCCFKKWCEPPQSYGFVLPGLVSLWAGCAIWQYKIMYFFQPALEWSCSLNLNIIMNIDPRLAVYGVVKSGKRDLCLIYLKGKYRTTPHADQTLSSYLCCLSHVCSIKFPLLKEGWIVPFMHYVGMHM